MIVRHTSVWFALVTYAFGAFVVPELHRLHHEAHGEDHVHTAAGTIYRHHDEHPAPQPFNPEHGRNALEHLGVSILAAKKIVAPVPAIATVRRQKPIEVAVPSLTPRHPYGARAPPV